MSNHFQTAIAELDAGLGQCEAISRIAGALIDACEFEADRREEGDADTGSA
jgi:hypothetical protein